jgi:hypothetical protein
VLYRPLFFVERYPDAHDDNCELDQLKIVYRRPAPLASPSDTPASPPSASGSETAPMLGCPLPEPWR